MKRHGLHKPVDCCLYTASTEHEMRSNPPEAAHELLGMRGSPQLSRGVRMHEGGAEYPELLEHHPRICFPCEGMSAAGLQT